MRATICTALSFAAATLVAPAIHAQTAVAGRPGQQPSGTTAPLSSGQTPAPRAWLSSPPQGFSVVLVLGDLQGTAPSDDVPPAARKALVDMKEFLPFKSYRLLDAAWLMCCGQDPRPGAATAGSTSRGGGVNRGASAVSQVLRGPEDKEYELRLETARAENGRVFVRFSLRSSSNELAEIDRRMAADYADAQAQQLALEKEIAQRRRDGQSEAAETKRLEQRLQQLQRALVDHKISNTRANQARAEKDDGRAVIDTSFTMDVGETVVVGTSRLKGGSRALIALLTAVPPRGAERRE